MVTLSDLLDNFGLTDGEEKVASDETQTADEEQALLESLLDGEEKTASEGDDSMSLADLYLNMVQMDEEAVAGDDDFDKIAEAAAAEEVSEEMAIEKVAAEYDAAGRIMARGFFDEFHKLARELEDASAAATPALGQRGTQYQMETNLEPKGPISTKGSQSVNADAIKSPGQSTDLGAEKAMGPQFHTAKHLFTSRAGQADAK